MAAKTVGTRSKRETHNSNLKGRSLVAIIITWAIGISLLVLVFCGMAFHESVFSWLSSWPESIRWLKIVLGVILAISFVLFFFLAIMLTYLNMRQKWAKAKFRVELLIFVPTFLLSIGVKLAVILLDANILVTSEEPLTDTAGAILQAIYAAIGGLSFEGLPEITLLNELQLIPFYGTSIVAGLVFLGVLGSTFAYEAYSFVLIRVLYGWFPGKLRYNTYVFTALNDETLCLACSVANTDDNAVIIFAGPALEPFDRHNELCAEVMGNGFLYWSYYENADVSIASSLGLKRKSNLGSEGKRFYVFAFDTDANERPEEEKNADAVFDDGKARKSHPDKFYIHYILLGRGENDYQAYEVLRKHYLDPSNSSLSLWTEAKAIATQVASYLKNADILDACIPNRDITTVRSIGFGETARAITKEIYIQSVMAGYKDKDSLEIVESKFEADIYDARSLEIAGFFKKDNPYAICYQKGKPAPEDNSNLNCPIYCFNEKNYTHLDIVNDNGSDPKEFDYCVIATGDDRENINIANSIIAERLGKADKKKLVLFITVYDKRNNIYLTASNEILAANDKSDKNKTKRERMKVKFDLEVKQIGTTNMFAHEEALTYRKNIYYYGEHLIAVIVGNREDTFQFPHIRYQRRNSNFDCLYNDISSKVYEYTSGSEIKAEATPWATCLNGMRVLYQNKTILNEVEWAQATKDTVSSILDEYRSNKTEDSKRADTSWNKLDLWSRQSNIELGNYSRTYFKIIATDYPDILQFIQGITEGEKEANMNNVDGNTLCRAMALLTFCEHARWNRVHIAAGWRFGKKDKDHRVHDCLVPMTELAKADNVPWSYIYDLVNALHSIKTFESREKEIIQTEN